MNIGDEFSISLGYHYGGKITDKSSSRYRFRVICICKDDVSYKKDLIVCQEVNYGYRECFHRIELEGKTNENRNNNETAKSKRVY